MTFKDLDHASIISRLSNEQRAAIADYFRVYKVEYHFLWNILGKFSSFFMALSLMEAADSVFFPGQWK